MMTEEQLKNMASQLRKPTGEDGVKIAEMMSTANAHIIHDTLRALKAEAFDNILEIGMGNGFHVKNILESANQIRYNGCDYSTLMIEESRRINAEWISKGQAKFKLANVSSLPFSDNEFNKVFTVNTVYFWENEKDTLREIKRIMQPGGKLIIGFRPKHEMEKYPFTKYGFTLFSATDVEELLRDNGFTISSISKNQEPDFDLNGKTIQRENVVVVAGMKNL